MRDNAKDEFARQTHRLLPKRLPPASVCIAALLAQRRQSASGR
jgi:hypothetical protein